jgi:uncharacterized membrane protein YdjX (TVP38/TMEM64 family)
MPPHPEPPSSLSISVDTPVQANLVDVELSDDSQRPKPDPPAMILAPDETPQATASRATKAALALGIVLIIALIVVDSLTTSYVRDGLDTFLEWVEDNAVAGVFVFTVVYACATILFIPGSILTLGAGFVFSAAFGSLGAGLLVGSAVVFTGASAGALVAFLVGRYVGREWVTRVLVRKYNLVAALEGALQGRKGLRIMCLLRLSPIIPFNAINYIAGATPLSLMHYTMALLAILPGTVLYVFLGASAGSLTDSMSSGSDPTVTIIVVVVGLAFGVLAIGLTSYYAKKELGKIVAARQAELETDTAVDTDEEVGTAD